MSSHTLCFDYTILLPTITVPHMAVIIASYGVYTYYYQWVRRVPSARQASSALLLCYPLPWPDLSCTMRSCFSQVFLTYMSLSLAWLDCITQGSPHGPHYHLLPAFGKGGWPNCKGQCKPFRKIFFLSFVVLQPCLSMCVCVYLCTAVIIVGKVSSKQSKALWFSRDTRFAHNLETSPGY
jgi:hypothetical protein